MMEPELVEQVRNPLLAWRDDYESDLRHEADEIGELESVILGREGTDRADTGRLLKEMRERINHLENKYYDPIHGGAWNIASDSVGLELEGDQGGIEMLREKIDDIQGEVDRQARARDEATKVQKSYDQRLRERSNAIQALSDQVMEQDGDGRTDALTQVRAERGKLTDLQEGHRSDVHDAADGVLEKMEAYLDDGFAGEIAEQHRYLDDIEKNIRLQNGAEEGHLERLVNRQVDALEKSIATKLGWMAAALFAEWHFPGMGATSVHVAEFFWRACKTAEKLDSTSAAVRIGVPVTVFDGSVELDLGITLSDDEGFGRMRPPKMNVGWNLGSGTETSTHVGTPRVDVVEDGDDRKGEMSATPPRPPSARSVPRSRRVKEVADGGPPKPAPADAALRDKPLHIGLVEEGTGARTLDGTRVRPSGKAAKGVEREGAADTAPEQASETTTAGAAELGGSVGTNRQAGGREPGSTGSAHRRPPATGVVIVGSAKEFAAAMRKRYLTALGLVAYARTLLARASAHEPAAVVMRRADNLEIVVFVDPDIGGGLWVEIDPGTQLPVAVLLIEIVISEDDELQSVRLLQPDA